MNLSVSVTKYNRPPHRKQFNRSLEDGNFCVKCRNDRYEVKYIKKERKKNEKKKINKNGDVLCDVWILKIEKDTEITN